MVKIFPLKIDMRTLILVFSWTWLHISAYLANAMFINTAKTQSFRKRKWFFYYSSQKHGQISHAVSRLKLHDMITVLTFVVEIFKIRMS